MRNQFEISMRPIRDQCGTDLRPISDQCEINVRGKWDHSETNVRRMWNRCGPNLRPTWDQSKTNERPHQEDRPSPTTEPPYQLQAGLIGTEMHEGPASQPSRGHHLAQWPASRTNHGNYNSLSDMLPCAAFPFANTLEGWELLWQWKTCEKSYFLGGCLATLEHPCLLLCTCVCRLHQWSCKLQSSSHAGIINLEHAPTNRNCLCIVWHGILIKFRLVSMIVEDPDPFRSPLHLMLCYIAHDISVWSGD